MARRGIEAIANLPLVFHQDFATSLCGGGEMVYFLEAVWPPVAEPKFAGYGSQREPPRILQAILFIGQISRDLGGQKGIAGRKIA